MITFSHVLLFLRYISFHPSSPIIFLIILFRFIFIPLPIPSCQKLKIFKENTFHVPLVSLQYKYNALTFWVREADIHNYRGLEHIRRSYLRGFKEKCISREFLYKMRPKRGSSIEREFWTPNGVMLLTSHKAHLSVCAHFLIPSFHITATVFFGVEQTRQPFGRFCNEFGLVF